MFRPRTRQCILLRTKQCILLMHNSVRTLKVVLFGLIKNYSWSCCTIQQESSKCYQFIKFNVHNFNNFFVFSNIEMFIGHRSIPGRSGRFLFCHLQGQSSDRRFLEDIAGIFQRPMKLSSMPVLAFLWPMEVPRCLQRAFRRTLKVF